MKNMAACSNVHKSSIFVLIIFLLLGCGSLPENEKKELLGEIAALQKEVKSVRTENARLKELMGEKLSIGFEVQIAAFSSFNLDAYSDELVRLQERRGHEYNKYILGQFSQLEDAEAFLEDVHEMGITDAFISGIVDGKRSSISEAQAAAEAYYGDVSVGEFASDWEEE